MYWFKNSGSAINQFQLKSQLCPILAMWPWTNYFIFNVLIFSPPKKKKKWEWWKVSWSFHKVFLYVWGLRIIPCIQREGIINCNKQRLLSLVSFYHHYSVYLENLEKKKLIKILYCRTFWSLQCVCGFPKQCCTSRIYLMFSFSCFHLHPEYVERLVPVG